MYYHLLILLLSNPLQCNMFLAETSGVKEYGEDYTQDSGEEIEFERLESDDDFENDNPGDYSRIRFLRRVKYIHDLILFLYFYKCGLVETSQL